MDYQKRIIFLRTKFVKKENAVRRRKFGISDACLPPNDERLCAYLRPLKNFRKEPQLLKKVKTELGFNPGLSNSI